MQQEEARRIATTILQQMGGNRFIAMTGAKNFAFGSEGSLTFHFPSCKKWNLCQVELDPSDTYTVTFMKIRGTEIKSSEPHSDIYCDMLQDLFTEETGLYTHF